MAGVIWALIRPGDVVHPVQPTNAGPRAATAQELAALAGAGAIAADDLPSAFKAATAAARPDDPVCVCGSLYLVGECKSMLRRER